MENNKIFSNKFKTGLSIIILLGLTVLGLGIGLLVNKIVETILISIGAGLLIIAIFWIKSEYEKY